MAALDDDMDWLDENENAGPALKRKKAAAPKKKKAPLAALDANAVPDADGGKSIEQTYQKLSQLEHILLRPDTYVGSIERQQQQAWVLREPTALDGALDGAAAPIKFEHRTIDFVPGLYKIFDEILVNACDHRVRDATMDTLRVDFDPAQGLVRVFNNGKGIPVEMHKTEKVHVPELIFGHLLTSSNYNDGEKKLTGGRNGYGSKLTNIFSKEFVVETCDGERKRKYRQKFQNNMKQIGAPEISACKAKDNWTCVTFRPDLERFGLSNLSGDDTLALMRKRVVDAAGSLGKGVKVFLDGKKLPIASFQDYCNLYIGDPKKDGATAMPRVYERVNDRWEVCATMSEGQFNQVSFVNSICTLKGGTHANVVADQIASKLLGTKALKGHEKLKPFQVKNHVWVFVNALIENPAFDSQTKDFLTLKASAFGSKCELSDAFMKKFEKTGIVDNILSWANFKQSKELKKTDGSKKNRLTGIPKLDDANDAGGRNSEHCTLILTEGDSAKALAVSGLGVVGRDRFGVFPLRGKLLNVRDASHTQVMNNAEISHLKQILGLQHGKQYADTKSLRYGHLMIMTDQDHDGSHIKGLVINFLHHFFPSLVKMPGFLVEFITPIVKATRGKEQRIFYTLPEYEGWKETVGNQKWSIKYYKGLGTSTAKEAKEYFSELTRNSKQFVYNGHEDGQLIEMVFSKKHVDSRKQWLSDFRPGTFLDHSASEIGFSDFINKELILFSRADLERSIPSVLDGLKPGQRKIMFCGFKRNLKSDIKVAQLAGYVSEHSAYHHGEQSLASTIVGLAQDYVGSNNVNILTPSGQFGTRLQGGKDSASPRYIYTRLGPLTRHIFKEDDDCLLNYLDEDGQTIEPEWYMPVLPMVLVNGADGIGTGWSTFIPNYNPRDIVANVKRYIDGMPMKPMVPWYKNFTGEINRIAGKSSSAGESFSVTGIINIIDDTTIEIVELPLRKWVQDYKEFLEGLIKPEKKDVKPLITDYKEDHTDTSVRFVITMPKENLAMAQETGLYKTFKLLTTMSTTNMHLFSSDGVIKKYDAPQAIIEEFCEKRLEFYDLRKQHKLKDEEEQMRRLDNKKRFILCVVNEEVILAKQKKADIEARLDFLGFDRLTKTKKQQGGAKGASAADAGAGEEDGDAPEGSEGSRGAKLNFDYLLSMPLWSLSLEKVEELEREYEEKKASVATIKATKPTQTWVEDLDAFEEALASAEAEEQKQMAELQEQALKAQGKAAGKGKGKGKGRKAKAAPPPAQGVKVAPPIIEAKPTAARKAKAKKAAPKPSASAAGAGAGGDAPADVSPIDVDSEDDFMPSLMERLASRKANSISDPEISAPSAPAAKKTTAAAAKKKAAPKRKPATKAAPKKGKACDAMEGVDGIEEDEEDVFMLDSPSPAAAPKAKATRRASPVPMRTASTRPKKPTKKAVVLSDSDEESDYESDGDISYDDESDGDDSDFSCSD